MTTAHTLTIGSYGNRPYTLVAYAPIGTYATGYKR